MTSQITDVASKHEDNHDALHSLFHEHKGHYDVSKAAHTGNLEEAINTLKDDVYEKLEYLKQDVTEAFQAALKDETAAGNAKHSSLQDLMDGHKAALDTLDSTNEDKLQKMEENLRQELAAVNGKADGHRAEHAGKASELMSQIDVMEAKIAEQHKAHAGATDAKHGEMKAYLDAQLGAHGAKNGAKQDELQNLLGGHKAELQAELKKMASGQSDHSAKLDALDDALRGDIDVHKAEHAAALDTMRKEIDSKNDALSEAMKGHRGEFDSHKAEMQFALDEITGNHGKHTKAMDEMEAALRAELSGHKGNHAALEEALKGLRGEFDAHKAKIEAELAKINGVHGKHSKALDDMEAALRAELKNHKGTHADLKASHDQLRSDLADSLKGQSALEANLRKELAKLSSEHGGNLAEHQKKYQANHEDLLRSHSELSDMFSRHKSDLTRHQGALEDHKKSTAERVERLEQDLRKQLSVLDDKHGDSLKSIMDHARDSEKQVKDIEARLKEDHARAVETLTKDHNAIKDIIHSNKKVLDDALDNMKHESDRTKAATTTQIEKLDDDLREELRQKVMQNRDLASAEAQRVRESLHDTKSTLEDRMTRELARMDAEFPKFRSLTDGVDKALRREISRIGGEQAVSLDDYKQEAHKHHLGLNRVIDEERQKNDFAFIEVKDRIMLVEQQREDAMVGRNYISTVQFKEEIMRIWEAVDTHTHDMGVAPTREIVVQQPAAVSVRVPSITRESGSVSVTPRVEQRTIARGNIVSAAPPYSPQTSSRSPEPRVAVATPMQPQFTTIMAAPPAPHLVEEVITPTGQHFQVYGR